MEKELDPLRVAEFSDTNIMTNLVHPKAKDESNMWILVAKQHIFANKCLGKATNFQDVKITMEMIKRTGAYNKKQIAKLPVKNIDLQNEKQ